MASFLDSLLPQPEIPQPVDERPTFYMFVTWSVKRGMQTSQDVWPAGISDNLVDWIRTNYTERSKHWSIRALCSETYGMPDPSTQALVDGAKVLSNNYYHEGYSDRQGDFRVALFHCRLTSPDTWEGIEPIPVKDNDVWQTVANTTSDSLHRGSALFGCLFNARLAR